jgi:membrane protein required for colicin V production
MALHVLTGWDWFVLVVGVVSIALGLWRGMVRTLFGLAAWVAALVGTPLLAPMVIEALEMEGHPFAVFFALFVVTLVTVKVLGAAIAHGVGAIGLGAADRGLGGALGAARALLVITLVVAGARALDLDQTAAWRTAYSRPLLDTLVHFVEPYLPERISGIRET